MKYIILIFLIFYSTISSAKVTLEKLDEYDKFHRQYVLLYLSESIEKGDVQSFQDAIDTINKEGLHLKYDSVIMRDSRGGNVESAKKISRIIRKNKLSTAVPRNRYCNSACLYVFIGGICRMGLGEIGIHRGFSPYDFQRRITLDEARHTTDKLYNDDIKFFEEMNARSSLVSMSNQVPNWTIKYLSHDEKLQYGFYSTIEEYEAERIQEVTMNTGRSKDELMTSLEVRYYELNNTKPINKLKQFFMDKLGFEFKKEDPIYPRCSEQLFLTDAH